MLSKVSQSPSVEVSKELEDSDSVRVAQDGGNHSTAGLDLV